MKKNNSSINLEQVNLPENLIKIEADKFLELITKFCSYYKNSIT